MKKRTSTPRGDRVLALLERRNNADLKFLAATDEVVAGHDLESSGNRAYGKNVYVSTSSAPNVDRQSLLIGTTLRVGAREQFRRGELCCDRSGADVIVAIYDKRGKVLTRTLICAEHSEDEVDEGLFTWIGPKELYCTPWSDSDPAYCQVVTVERLREWARSNT